MIPPWCVGLTELWKLGASHFPLRTSAPTPHPCQGVTFGRGSVAQPLCDSRCKLKRARTSSHGVWWGEGLGVPISKVPLCRHSPSRQVQLSLFPSPLNPSHFLKPHLLSHGSDPPFCAASSYSKVPAGLNAFKMRSKR